MPTGADLFVRTIIDLGIDRFFTLVGDHLNEVLAVAAKAGIEIVHMRHESGVTHAAGISSTVWQSARDRAETEHLSHHQKHDQAPICIQGSQPSFYFRCR